MQALDGLIGNLAGAQVTAGMGDIHDDVVSELAVAVIPPGGVIDTAASAVVTFYVKDRDQPVIEFQTDIGRPVIVIARCFRTDLKGELDPGRMIPGQGFIRKTVVQIPSGEPDQGGMNMFGHIKAVGRVFLIKIQIG